MTKKIVFCVLFSFLYGVSFLKGAFFLGTMPLKKKPEAIEVFFEPCVKGDKARVVLYAAGSVVFKGCLKEAAALLMPLMPKAQIQLQKGALVYEKDLPSFIAESDRRAFVKEMATALFHSDLKALGAERDKILAALFPKKVLPSSKEPQPDEPKDHATACSEEATHVFGPWNAEITQQDIESKGGIREDGFLKRPHVPQRLGDQNGGQAPGAEGWRFIKGEGRDTPANALHLVLWPGKVQLQNADGKNLWVPLVFTVKERKDAAKTRAQALCFFWVRAMACLGTNDLQGPLSKQIGALTLINRPKGDDTPQQAVRVGEKVEEAWVIHPDSQRKVLNAALKETPQAQHVLSVFDIGGVGVWQAAKGTTRGKMHVVAMKPVGVDNQPGQWAFSRVATYRQSAFKPCPLRFAEGTRLLIGHTLSPKTAEEVVQKSQAPKASSDPNAKPALQ